LIAVDSVNGYRYYSSCQRNPHKLDERFAELEQDRTAGAVTVKEYHEVRTNLIRQQAAIEALA
jgi:hypothetical protein